MSPPSCATAGRTRVSISSLIWSMMSASAGSSSNVGFVGDVDAGGAAGREQRRAADEMVEQGLEHQRLEVGPGDAGRRGHRDEVAAEEHALDHAAVEQAPRRAARLRRSRRRRSRACPASITVWPGRNLRVAGLGVCSVWISMAAMWRLRAVAIKSRERRRAGDDPASDREGDRQAERRPTICPARIGTAPGCTSACP